MLLFFSVQVGKLSEKTPVCIKCEYEKQKRSFYSQIWCRVTFSFATLTSLAFTAESCYELTSASLLRDNYFISLECQRRFRISSEIGCSS